MSVAKLTFALVLAVAAFGPQVASAETQKAMPKAAKSSGMKGPAPTGRSVNGPASKGAGTGENKPTATGGAPGGGTEQQ